MVAFTDIRGRTRSARVDQSTGCWVWEGHISPEGYGKWGVKYVHRLVYEQVVGPIPEHYQVDHLCNNRSCCNPAHLEAVPPSVNNERAFARHGGHHNSRKTHCPHGHEYTPENTYLGKSGSRFCKTCAARRSQEWQAKANGAGFPW